jgi:AcrR family transcriptional regulator
LGGRLRHDIVEAARELIAASGDADQLTLRGVAKRIGIAAPSIYRHFPDLDHLKLEVVEQAFLQFMRERDEARTSAGDPASALLAGCRAYCAFAVRHPGEYRFMFSHESPAKGRQSRAGAAAFAALANSIRFCQETGACVSDAAPDLLATDVWAALHGIALLRINAPEFQWFDDMNSMVDRVVSRIVDISPAVSEPETQHG